MEKATPASKTSIGDFQFCPWFYHATRVLGVKKEFGMAAMNGISAHKLISQVILGELDIPEALVQAPNTQVRNFLTQTNHYWPLEHMREEFARNHLTTEETVYVSEAGNRIKSRAKALCMGIVDIAIKPSNGVAYITDWKSGKWVKDDEFERDLYAGLLGPVMFPECEEIVFTLRYIQSGDELVSRYRFSKTKGTIIVKDPDGGISVRAGIDNPILERVRGIVDDIKAAEPAPKPGPHCKKHYGSPCQLYSDGSCPHWAEKLKKE